MNAPTREEIEEVYNSGLSIRNVAKHFGISNNEMTYLFRKYDIPRRPPIKDRNNELDNNPNWKGGVTTRRGWKLIRDFKHPNSQKSGYVAEHTVVACEKYGVERVNDGDCVHHIDLNKENNSPENLSILTNSEHKTAHEQLGRLAIEMLHSSGVIVWDDETKQYRKSDTFQELCRSCDNRTDELRLLGNGVMPATAELAWRVLYERIK